MDSAERDDLRLRERGIIGPSEPKRRRSVSPDWDPDEPDPDPSYQGEPFDDDGNDGRAATPAGMAGGAQLKAYWTKGEGLAKWAGSAHPWTALYRHLVKHMPAGKAKRTAAAWFHAVKGYWPGHQKGKNPVGPG